METPTLHFSITPFWYHFPMDRVTAIRTADVQAASPRCVALGDL
jgi:hypothetical protein